MTGLFLRYCAACNTTAVCAISGTADLKCSECGSYLQVFDAHALIPALGRKMNQGHREAAVADLPGHDLPSA